MCEFCSVGTEWLVYTTNRMFSIQVCSGHLAKAIGKKHSESKSDETVHAEPINN